MPGRDTSKEKEEKQAVFRNVEQIAESLIEEKFRKDCHVSVQEIQCGDPQCSPIDTVVTIVFDR